MFLIAVVALSLLTVPLAGGSLSKISDLHLRWTPVIFAALAIQVVIVSVAPGGDHWLHALLHLLSYGLAGAFLWVNRHQPGIRMVALGAMLNATAIVANNGVMPASPSALRAAGEATHTNGFVNSTGLTHPRLLFLGDVFAIPESWPLHNVFSIGDVCIGIGAAIAIHTISGSRLVRRRSRPASADASEDRPGRHRDAATRNVVRGHSA